MTGIPGGAGSHRPRLRHRLAQRSLGTLRAQLDAECHSPTAALAPTRRPSCRRRLLPPRPQATRMPARLHSIWNVICCQGRPLIQAAWAVPSPARGAWLGADRSRRGPAAGWRTQARGSQTPRWSGASVRAPGLEPAWIGSRRNPKQGWRRVAGGKARPAARGRLRCPGGSSRSHG